MIFTLEKLHKERSIVPDDPGQAFLAYLLEDMADEWGVKIAFLYRWGHDEDASYKSRIVTGELIGGDHSPDILVNCANHFAARQQSRMPLVGATPLTRPLIEASFDSILDAFDRLPGHSTYLFGEQPTLADFGWYGQLVSLATDPTSWAQMRRRTPDLFAWLQLMDDGSGIEPSKPRETPAMSALLEVAGKVYLPFLAANAEAIDAGRGRFSFRALGHSYEQGVFRYQQKCLRWLRDEFVALKGADRNRAETLLGPTGCLEILDKTNT